MSITASIKRQKNRGSNICQWIIYCRQKCTQDVETGTEKEKIIVLSALPDTERKIVGFILENPGITQEQIAENMGMSKNGIRY